MVTGSRIRRKDLTTPAPVTVINRATITASGKVSIGDFLQSLPEQGNAINTNVNNGGSGATRISLRGLGTARTLVLLNGRRFVPGGSGADSSVDLNSIPTAVIERVEVLKDGASAIYGSDAIAGVVNLITRKNFTGVDAAAYGGISPHGDGANYDLSLTTGASGEQGNLIFSAGYFKAEPVFAGDRAFASVPRNYDATGKNNPLGTIGEYSAGSGTIPQGRFFLPASDRSPNGNATYNAIVTYFGPKVSSYIRDPNSPACSGGALTGCTVNGWRPFVPFFVPPRGDGYNFQPENYLATPQQRISLYASGDHRLSSSSKLFFEASYVNRQSSQRLAPEPLVTGGEGITVSKDNLYNPFNRDFKSMFRRLLEFGPRGRRQDIDTFRVVGGVDGTFSDDYGPLQGWFWEIAGNYGRVQGIETKLGDLRRTATANALGPSFADATGKHCGTPGKIIAGCVPLNLFGGPGTITPDQVTGLLFTGNARGLNQLAGVTANLAGELPLRIGNSRPVGVAFGYEYRNVQGASIPDPYTVAADATGNKGTITEGKYYANEGFTELQVPLLADLPGAELVEATAAARLFKYNNFGSDFTYKFGGRWRVVPDFTLRGTYSTAFRAPSVSDLFLGQSDSFPNVQDPCRDLSKLPDTDPLVRSCLAQGVPRGGSNDPSKQLRSRIGGYPGLVPETAKTFTAGIVLEPQLARGLSITVDYYNIAIDKSISSIGAAVILAACHPNGTNCEKIQRDSNGVITNILDVNANVGNDRTDGVDLAVRYTRPTEVGNFGFGFDGTWLHKFNRTLADGTVIHGKGTFDLGNGTGGVYPDFKFNAGVSYAVEGLALGVNTRFISAFRECGDSGGDFSGSGLCYQSSLYSRRVSAYNVYDVQASYFIRTGAGKTSLAVGVNNVFNSQPPTIYNGFLAASDPTAYDFIGRYPYARLEQSF